MCLAIPGKVVEIRSHEGMQMARVQFGGVTRDACLDYVPETQVGDYVLVHVGFAISRVDEDEARKTWEALAAIDALGELEIPEIADGPRSGS
jgi:hydrogenase expression/formation protein HypC